jgi:UDPglucose 6-dehydrogenase
VRAYDPAAMDEARKLLPGVTWCRDEYEALAGADAMVLLTEWNEFRALDLARVKSVLRAPIVVDLRNVYRPDEMAEAGFTYVSVGRPPVNLPAAAPAVVDAPPAERVSAR